MLVVFVGKLFPSTVTVVEPFVVEEVIPWIPPT
jgi:hypothetical protein